MLEIIGDILRPNSWSIKATTVQIALFATTNGVVKANGQAVMGAGVAKTLALAYPQLPKILGSKLNSCGNQVHYLLTDRNIHILSFPTKHHWQDPSDLSLVENSARTLAEIALLKPYCTFVLPRPGCGLGGLSWSIVKNLIAPILPDNCWIIEHNL